MLNNQTNKRADNCSSVCLKVYSLEIKIILNLKM